MHLLRWFRRGTILRPAGLVISALGIRTGSTVSFEMRGATMTGPWHYSSGSSGRWDPVREFEDLYTQMGRLMGTAFGPPGGAGTRWVPLADLSETDDAYLVEVDLPGVKSKDINIEVVGNELLITGEVKQSEQKGLLRRKQRRVGEFELRVALPHEVDADRIEANLAEGVLTVRVPKGETAKARRIKVTEGS
jgi:HSP20 family protein